jgi:hypothetical protein
MLASSDAEFYHLFDRVIIDEDRHCWNWQGYRTEDGYGRLSWNGELYLAHRLSLYLHDRISQALLDDPKIVVMHRCDNPACINPDHLVAATQKENIADRSNKKRTASHLGNRGADGRFTKINKPVRA